MTRVSVIVPTYNCGHFIAEAIDSILGQTRVPEQIIIVDDGSTDDTEQVVRRYTDPRIEYIRQANAGVSAARNAGLDAARSKFVTFLDADDRWRPTFVEHMLELFDDYSATCAFGNFVRFQHATGEVMRDQFQYYPELHGDGVADFRRLVGMGEIPAFPVVMMFRRDRIDGLRFDPALKICEDMHFSLCAFMRGRVAFTSEVLAEVRRHDTNVTRNHSVMALHKLNALRALAPHVSTAAHRAAYQDRLVKAHIDAALHQARSGRVRAGLRTYLDGLGVRGAPMRKLKGLVRMALLLPRALAQPI